MDAEALKKLWAYLMSQPQLAELLHGIVGQEAGQIHVVLANGQEAAAGKQVEQFLESISEQTGQEIDLQELTELGGPSGVGLQIMTLLCQMNGVRPAIRPASEARTLREAIDCEWPW